MEIRKNVKALSEYGPVVDMPNESSIIRKSTKAANDETVTDSENEHNQSSEVNVSDNTAEKETPMAQSDSENS